MQYLITINNEEPFFTSYFELSNDFNDQIEMVVYDLYNCKYTNDGINWNDIEIDHL